MNDFFSEQIIKKKEKTIDLFKKFGVIGVCCFISVFSLLLIPKFGLFIVVVVIFLGVYIHGLLDIEYEYAITNNNFEVDTIYGKKKRKKTIEINVKDIIVMTKLNSNEDLHTFNTSKKIYDLSSGVNKDNCYKFIIKIKGENSTVIIEPNDKILEGFKIYLGRGIFKE